MRSRIVVVAVVLSSFASVSLALDPVGPPKSVLDRGGWSFGIEYAYSETDVDPSGLDDGGFVQILTANRIYGNLRYGVSNNVDLFVRAGAAMFDLDTGFWGFDGKADFAWGLGVAATLHDADKLDWGVLAQFSSGKSIDRSIGFPDGIDTSEIRIQSFQLAAGPTYQIKDDLAAYGGVFYHLLEGEYEGVMGEWDLNEDSAFGGFVGLDWEVKEDADWTAEIQTTGTAFALSTGLRFTLK